MRVAGQRARRMRPANAAPMAPANIPEKNSGGRMRPTSAPAKARLGSTANAAGATTAANSAAPSQPASPARRERDVEPQRPRRRSSPRTKRAALSEERIRRSLGAHGRRPGRALGSTTVPTHRGQQFGRVSGPSQLDRRTANQFGRSTPRRAGRRSTPLPRHRT